MTADIQAAKERLTEWASDGYTVRFDTNGYLVAEDIDTINTILAELSRLETALAESNEARAILQQAVHDLLAERKEARRQIAERDEALKAADDALCEYACMDAENPTKPCLRSAGECAHECGKPAFEALRQVRAALLSPPPTGGAEYQIGEVKSTGTSGLTVASQHGGGDA